MRADQLRRSERQPLIERYVSVVVALEDFQEAQHRVAGILDVVPHGKRHVTDMCGPGPRRQTRPCGPALRCNTATRPYSGASAARALRRARPRPTLRRWSWIPGTPCCR